MLSCAMIEIFFFFLVSSHAISVLKTEEESLDSVIHPVYVQLTASVVWGKYIIG